MTGDIKTSLRDHIGTKRHAGAWCCAKVSKDIMGAVEEIVMEGLRAGELPPWTKLVTWFQQNGYPEASLNRVRGHFENHVPGYMALHREVVHG